MRSNAPAITELRIQRFHRWALLWLKWFASFLNAASANAPLSKQATAIGHQWLDRIEALVANVILVRAAARLRPMQPPKHAAHRRIGAHLKRAIIGSAMRQSLRPRRLDQRIAALSQNIESLVARLLKRLPRGLTRRRPIRTRPEMRRAETARACNVETPPGDTS
jgi:hypothetical protein